MNLFRNITRKLPAQVAVFAILAFTYAPIAQPASAKSEIDQALTATQNWKQAVDQLEDANGGEIALRLSVRSGNKFSPKSLQFLSVDPADYINTRFVRALKPIGKIPKGSRILRNIVFEYGQGKKARKVGTLSYAIINANGQINEIGVPTEALEKEFNNSIARVVPSPEQISRIESLNREMFTTLRANPIGQQHVKAFLQERKWPEGMDVGELAYFSSEVTPLKPWAKAHGYSLEEMRNAGWMTKTFDPYGRPIYLPTESNSIKIPYFADVKQTRIEKFNSRMLFQIDPKTPKYKTASTNKTFKFDPVPNAQLFNAQLLENAEGKTLVITEGELKALLTTETTGVITTAIPGISQFTPRMMRQIINAKAKKIVVLLDSDPLTATNSLFADGITNTQRAAFQLAKTLENYGANNVFVGTFPMNDKKVGGDDLIVSGELKDTVKKYLNIIDEAVPAEQFAKNLGMDHGREELLLRYQSLSRELKFYESTRLGISTERAAVVERTKALQNILEPAYKSFLPKIPRQNIAILPSVDSVKPFLPPILAPTANDWAIAQKSKQDAVFQVTLRPTIYGRGEDPLADIANLVSRVFPDQELTTMRRGMSLPIFNFRDLSLEDAGKLAATLKAMPAQEIKAARILGNVTIFDPTQLKIGSRVRDGVVRVGIIPSQEYLDWRKRLARLVAVHDPALGEAIQKSMAKEPEPLIELADWSSSHRRTLAQSKSDLQRLLSKELQKTSSKDLIQFNWSDRPLDLVTSNSFPNDAVQMSFRATDAGAIEPAQVSKWTSRYLNGRGLGTEKSIELYTEPLLNGETPKFQKVKVMGESEKVRHAQLEAEDFKQRVSPELREMLDKELRLNGNGRLPAHLDNELGADVYHSANTLINYAPERAAPIFETLALPKHTSIIGGYGVYGSTTNRYVKHPSDTDLLYNSIITVPDSIATQEEATLYARKVFRQNILDHYAKLASENKLTILEFRTGSTQTMKLPSNKISGSERFMEQPTLTQEEFIAGKYVDQTGKSWTLDELLALEEFPKLKLEVYEVVKGKRIPHEFSVQFLSAFNWKNELHFMRKGGIKGLRHSPVSTAAYYGADSYATAMLLERPMVQSAVQFGPGEVNSIRELLGRGWSQVETPTGYLASDPLLSTKFLKEYNRSTSYIQHTNPEIQAQIYSDTKAYMEKLGTWDKSITPEKITRDILKTINAPRVVNISELKSSINDLSEFNQRNQKMSLEFWQNRKTALIGNGKPGSTGVIGKIRKDIESGKIKPKPDFLSLLDDSEKILRSADQKSDIKSIMRVIVEPGLAKADKVNGRTLAKLEKAIVRLQNELHTQSIYTGALKKPIQDYIKTSVAIAPHSVSRAARARSALSDDELGLRYQLLGISDTPENIERMKYIDEVLDTASPDEIKRLQTEVVLAPAREVATETVASSVCAPIKTAELIRSIIH